MYNAQHYYGRCYRAKKKFRAYARRDLSMQKWMYTKCTVTVAVITIVCARTWPILSRSFSPPLMLSWSLDTINMYLNESTGLLSTGKNLNLFQEQK